MRFLYGGEADEVIRFMEPDMPVVPKTVPKPVPPPSGLAGSSDSESDESSKKSGSNCCEEAFAECGGFGRPASNKRNYTINDTLQSLGEVNTLISYAHDPDATLRFGSRNHRQDIDISCHEDQTRPDAA